MQSSIKNKKPFRSNIFEVMQKKLTAKRKKSEKDDIIKLKN